MTVAPLPVDRPEAMQIRHGASAVIVATRRLLFIAGVARLLCRQARPQYQTR